MTFSGIDRPCHGGLRTDRRILLQFITG